MTTIPYRPGDRSQVTRPRPTRPLPSYPRLHPYPVTTSRRPRTLPDLMTVCIAARSQYGHFVVTVSDTMFAAVDRSVDSGRSKVEIVNDRWVCMYSADESGTFLEVYPSIKRQLASSPANLADVIAAVESSYREALIRRFERRILHDCMMTHDEFIKSGRQTLGDRVFELKLDEMSRMNLALEVLMAGFDEGYGATHIISADAYGVCTIHDDMGFYAIGSGASAALAWLHTNDDFRNALYVVPIAHRLIEAKYCAETSTSVGKKKFDIVAIVPTKDGGEIVASMSPVEIESETIPMAREAWERRRNQKPEQGVLRAIYDSMTKLGTSQYLMPPPVDPLQTEDP
jgi:hypothetical protein